MKEMQSAFDGMSAEDQKILDSMGVKMPNMKNIQQMAAFAAANLDKAEPEVLFPKRDAGRIAAVYKTNLTKAGTAAYLQSVHQKIKQIIPEALQQKFQQQLEQLRSLQQGKNLTATAAVGYWTLGNPQAALLLMSQACNEDPSNDNNLNNLSAMLNMTGGEHLALPVLQLLNKQYPRNSTILNNIAHAWFGLGDITNALKYADSTIRLCAWHPQANQIKASIEENRGNQSGAVKAMKQAISRMHTPEKERKLDDLGYDLKSDDIVWGHANTPDQLGLSKFNWPGFAKSLDDCVLSEQAWNRFRAECEEQIDKLRAESEKLGELVRQRMHTAYTSGGAGSNIMAHVVPKAVIKLRPYVDQLLEEEAKDPWGLALIAIHDTLAVYQEETAKEIGEINKSTSPGGEGLGINEAYCDAIDGANDRLVRRANSFLEAVSTRYRDRARKRIRELVNYKMYFEFPEQFALSVNLAKIEWLGILMAPGGGVFRTHCNRSLEPPAHNTKVLAQFDDIHCPYRSRFSLGTNYIETACGKTTVKIEVPSLKSEWEFRSADREENRNIWDEFQRCTIEVSVGNSKKIGNGPMQLEAKATATGFLEYDRNGLQDAGIKVEVGVEINTNVLNTEVDTQGATLDVSGVEVGSDIGKTSVGPSEQSLNFGGAEATISINSGFTAGGTGILKGVKL